MNQRYEIVIHGHLTPQWTAIFDRLEVTCLPDGNTLIAGWLPDQSALYGLLMRLRDLGMILISVNPSSTLFSRENHPASSDNHPIE